MIDLQKIEHIAVFGIGRSGIAAANLLVAYDKQVTLSDTRTELALGDVLQQIDGRVRVCTEGNVFEGTQLVVVSPGLHPRVPVFAQLDDARIPYISEIELAYLLAKAPFVAISGTDGKTTTTTLVGEMFKRHLDTVAVAGNIGTPLCEIVQSIPDDGMIVAEVSAFQLWTTYQFRANVTGVTNIADDHMDYFAGDTHRYAQAKRQTLLHAQSSDWAVLNHEDPVVATWGEGFKGQVVYYGLDQDPEPNHAHCFWTEDGAFYGRFCGKSLGCWYNQIETLPLKGRHQHLNMLCAAAMALTQDVPMSAIIEALEQFEPLTHRMEPCGALDAIEFWNDSKATNVHAALAGLRGLVGTVVPIVGGVDKNLDLSDLVELLVQHTPAVVLIGALTQRISTLLIAASYPAAQIHPVESMEQAVELGFKLAQKHKAKHVSLSPACSSFDMYQSYAHRGDLFKDCVRSLIAQSS